MEGDATPTEPHPTATARLRIAGAWSGVLEVPLDEWTVLMLRSEISRRSGGRRSPEHITLISGGKVLKDAPPDDGEPPLTLAQAGLRANAKILASSAEPAGAQFAAEDKRSASEALTEAERSRRLARIRRAAEKMAMRHVDGSLTFEDYNIELEDQDGNKVNIGSETDQRGIMMGLMLHASAKKLIKNKKYKDALDILTMGEEVFSLCDPKLIEMVDNVPILQIDMVWCYFLLQDLSWLSMAGIRLENARKGLERSHGKDSSRFRILQGGRHAELAIYLRLELLEGVVAYHNGQFEKSQLALNSAHTKYRQLQVADEALSLLMSMGYKERSSKRALRMTNQDVMGAVDFLVEEKSKRARRRQEDMLWKAEIAEQKTYGLTLQKKAVDVQQVHQLESIGYERFLAAEALRVNENDTQKALDDLTNPETNSFLQLQIEKRKQQQRERKEDIEALVSMGHDRSAVTAAFHHSATKDDALKVLAAAAAAAVENSNLDDNAASASGQGTAAAEDGGLATSQDTVTEERDVEMEEEIAHELTGDPLADYDIEVSLEGEAISQYLAMLESAQTR